MHTIPKGMHGAPQSWFVPIYRHPDLMFEACMFALNPGARLPLHAHPQQFVLTVVLQGALAVN